MKKKLGGVTPSFPALQGELVYQHAPGEALTVNKFATEFPGVSWSSFESEEPDTIGRAFDNLYVVHLRSERWKVLRQSVLDRSKWICERCHLHAACEVHHLTYERLGN